MLYKSDPPNLNKTQGPSKHVNKFRGRVNKGSPHNNRVISQRVNQGHGANKNVKNIPQGANKRLLQNRVSLQRGNRNQGASNHTKHQPQGANTNKSSPQGTETPQQRANQRVAVTDEKRKKRRRGKHAHGNDTTSEDVTMHVRDGPTVMITADSDPRHLNLSQPNLDPDHYTRNSDPATHIRGAQENVKPSIKPNKKRKRQEHSDQVLESDFGVHTAEERGNSVVTKAGKKHRGVCITREGADEGMASKDGADVDGVQHTGDQGDRPVKKKKKKDVHGIPLSTDGQSEKAVKKKKKKDTDGVQLTEEQGDEVVKKKKNKHVDGIPLSTEGQGDTVVKKKKRKDVDGVQLTKERGEREMAVKQHGTKNEKKKNSKKTKQKHGEDQ